MSRYKSGLCFYYILSEMIPTFFLGIISFTFILLMFQILKFTDTFLQHSIGLFTLFHLLSSLSISFLPIILPMSLVLSIVLTYNRLSGDSEIIAMKSLGLGMGPLIAPGIVLGLVTTILSGYTSFKTGPWGHRQFELIITEITSSKIITDIREGTFSGFLDMVIYSNKIDKKTKEHKNVFIYDERKSSDPTTIIAEKGEFFVKKSLNSYQASMHLTNGHIHKSSELEYTKIHFQNYDLQITEPTHKKLQDKSLNSLTYKDIKKLLKETKDPHRLRKFNYEWHKRLSLSFACLLLVLLGSGFGCGNNNRSGRMGGGVISVAIIVIYWLLFLIGSSTIKLDFVPVWLSAWLPVLILTPFALFFIVKNWT